MSRHFRTSVIDAEVSGEQLVKSELKPNLRLSSGPGSELYVHRQVHIELRIYSIGRFSVCRGGGGENIAVADVTSEKEAFSQSSK